MIASEKEEVLGISERGLTLADKMANFLSTLISLKMAEPSEVKNAKRSFATKYFEFNFLREASLRAFSFAALEAIISEIKGDKLAVTYLILYASRRQIVSRDCFPRST